MSQLPFESLGLDWGKIKRDLGNIPSGGNPGEKLLKSLIRLLEDRQMNSTILGGTLLSHLRQLRREPLRLSNMNDYIPDMVKLASDLIDAVNSSLFIDIDLEVKILIMYSLKSWIQGGEYSTVLGNQPVNADYLINKINGVLDTNQAFVVKLDTLKNEANGGRMYFDANASSSLNILKIIDRLTTKMVDL